MDDFELPDGLRDELRAGWHRFLDRVEPFRPALFGYCRRLTGDLWDGEDLVQDTLIRAFAGLGRVHDPIRNPRAYLLRTATNLWIDGLRRRQRERALLEEHGGAAAADAASDAARRRAGEVRDAGQALLQRLAPRERAAVLLKDVFDLDLETSAEVLETSVGAVKAALHRGRGRLQEPEGGEASQRPRPSAALVDRFVALFNAEDEPGLLELVLDSAGVENVGVGYQWGREQHVSPKSWFHGALGDHPEWPPAFRHEGQRVERVDFRGEPVVLHFRTRGGRERLENVIRLEEQEGRIAHLRSYGFSPEVVREVGEALGLPVLRLPYRYPTPEPGRSYGDAAEGEGAA